MAKRSWQHPPCFLLFLLSLHLSCGRSVAEDVTPSPCKIGVIASLSGKGASRGQSAQLGISMALEEVRQTDPDIDKKISLVFENVPTDKPVEGVIAFGHLVDNAKVCSILGPMGSPVAMAVAPLAESSKTPIIVHTASAKKITTDKQWVFRLWPTAEQYADKIIAQLLKDKRKTLAVLSSENENNVDLVEALKEKLPKSIQLISDERVNPKETDFRTVLLRLSKNKAEILFINLFEGQIGIAIKQAREQKLTLPIFANSMVSLSDIDQAKEAMNNIWFPRFSGLVGEHSQISDPDTARAAHDALLILIGAINETGCDKAKIREYIAAGKFSYAIQHLRFIDRTSVLPIELYAVDDGKINLKK